MPPTVLTIDQYCDAPTAADAFGAGGILHGRTITLPTGHQMGAGLPALNDAALNPFMAHIGVPTAMWTVQHKREAVYFDAVQAAFRANTLQTTGICPAYTEWPKWYGAVDGHTVHLKIYLDHMLDFSIPSIVVTDMRANLATPVTATVAATTTGSTAITSPAEKAHVAFHEAMKSELRERIISFPIGTSMELVTDAITSFLLHCKSQYDYKPATFQTKVNMFERDILKMRASCTGALEFAHFIFPSLTDLCEEKLTPAMEILSEMQAKARTKALTAQLRMQHESEREDIIVPTNLFGGAVYERPGPYPQRGRGKGRGRSRGRAGGKGGQRVSYVGEDDGSGIYCRIHGYQGHTDEQCRSQRPPRAPPAPANP